MRKRHRRGVLRALAAVTIGALAVAALAATANAQYGSPTASPSGSATSSATTTTATTSPSATATTTTPTATATTTTPTASPTPSATATPACTTPAGATVLTLSGANEVPAVSSTGSATFSYSVSGTTVMWRLQATGTGLTMAHIHEGAAGTNGPIIYYLFGPDMAGVSSIDTCGTVGASGLIGPLQGKTLTDFVTQLQQGNLYVNIHSLAHPGGEMRVQIPGAAATPTPNAPSTGSGATGGNNSTPILLAAGGAIMVLLSGAGLVAARRRAR